ncbi:hypothetical protein [Leptolyngbya iicbica]|uniref:Uncharacterized protein n=2 Tax=Cyanophyceae TaxID=3028117 RepID=A0A4Q7E4P5_9CYAN|nr:hypothetical protein [Leptolyngbya sp. LK]RZM77188.1 hypothetical protein DYY88_16190 [Leptolyngbya sp. LK]
MTQQPCPLARMAILGQPLERQISIHWPQGKPKEAVYHINQPINQASEGGMANVANLDANLNELIKHGISLPMKHSQGNALTQLRIWVNTTRVIHPCPEKYNFVIPVGGLVAKSSRAG